MHWGCCCGEPCLPVLHVATAGADCWVTRAQRPLTSGGPGYVWGIERRDAVAGSLDWVYEGQVTQGASTERMLWSALLPIGNDQVRGISTFSYLFGGRWRDLAADGSEIADVGFNTLVGGLLNPRLTGAIMLDPTRMAIFASGQQHPPLTYYHWLLNFDGQAQGTAQNLSTIIGADVQGETLIIGGLDRIGVNPGILRTIPSAWSTRFGSSAATVGLAAGPSDVYTSVARLGAASLAAVDGSSGVISRQLAWPWAGVLRYMDGRLFHVGRGPQNDDGWLAIEALDASTFASLWSMRLQGTLRYGIDAAAAGGKLYVTTNCERRGQPTIWRLDPATGEVIWAV